MIISTKDKIVDAAIDLFSENGYAETAIRDIGKKAGIKSSSIYYHFESKEAILNYILNEYMKIISDSTQQDRWYEEKSSIISKDSKTSVDEIMNLMFFKFEEPNNIRYRKMVKIICSEAVRNEAVRNYFRYQSNNNFKYVKSVLDFLSETGKISKCDTAKLAGILYAITFAFMHFASIDIQSVSEEDEDTGMFSLLEYVLKLGVEGSRE